jgi:very-short-patch-repair endonuclease
VLLKEHLGDRPHEFEYSLEPYVFDLALFDSMTLVEFDGPYHNDYKQRKVDRLKDKAALEAGFTIARRITEDGVGFVLDPAILQGL